MSSYCPLCAQSAEVVFDLPSLPMTDIFVETGADFIDPEISTALVFCEKCCHAFLSQDVPYEILYGDHYAHATSKSQQADTATKIFLQFIQSHDLLLAGKTVLEFGSSDLTLAKYLCHDVKKYIAIDPGLGKLGCQIAAIEQHAVTIEESMKYLDTQIDVIICAHTIEHLQNPLAVLKNLFELTSSSMHFFVEVPSFDYLVESLRFDQVFHQHKHYFSLWSLVRLFDYAGFSLVSVSRNFSGFGGGTILAAFAKRSQERSTKQVPRVSYREVSTAIAAFQRRIDEAEFFLSRAIRSGDCPVLGWGASQLTPILAYHLPIISEFSAIIDNDKKKCGMKFPTLDIPIINPAQIKLADASIFITALDYSRSIISSMPPGPKKIFQPLFDMPL